MFVSAIVPSAGLGLRLRSSIPKPIVKLDRKPILIHTLDILSRHSDIKEIIVAVSRDNISVINREIKKYRIKKIRDLVLGGSQRRYSVENALKYVSLDADLVLVHDAVRPFIDLGRITQLVQQASKSGAAVLGVPVKAAIKEVDSQNRVIRTLKRESLFEVQTPQVFKRDIIQNAYKRFPRIEAVDDASLVEKTGRKVSVILGSYSNIKITTPEDLLFAKLIIRRRDYLG